MPRLGLKFLDGPAKQDWPVKQQLDELPETCRWVTTSTDTLDEVRRNY